jgi:hypothetical protein
MIAQHGEERKLEATGRAGQKKTGRDGGGVAWGYRPFPSLPVAYRLLIAFRSSTSRSSTSSPRPALER